MQCFRTRDTPCVSSSRTSSSSSVSSNHVFITMEDINAENCQRPRRTPLDLQFEVLSTDVDAAGSMMEGMTNVQALSPSISSFASLNTPTPSEFTTAIPSFASRSAGPQGDNISVLLGGTNIPSSLSGRSMFDGAGGGTNTGTTVCDAVTGNMVSGVQTRVLGGGVERALQPS